MQQKLIWKSNNVGLSDFPKETELACLKSDVDKLDIDKSKNVLGGVKVSKSKVDKLVVSKLKPVSTDLRKISVLIEKEVVKKSKYNTDKL